MVRYHLNNEIQEANRRGNAEEVDTLQRLRDQIYVDNLIMGTDSPDKISYLYKLVKRVFDKASLNMRAWASNIPKFNELVPESDLDKSKTQKVSGIPWQLDKDEFQLCFRKGKHKDEIVTKRTISSRLAQNYDPLGWAAPSNLKAKLLV